MTTARVPSINFLAKEPFLADLRFHPSKKNLEKPYFADVTDKYYIHDALRKLYAI